MACVENQGIYLIALHDIVPDFIHCSWWCPDSKAPGFPTSYLDTIISFDHRY